MWRGEGGGRSEEGRGWIPGEEMKVGKRERERERQTDRQSQRERETERETDRQTAD